jgi:hypothetical protein
MVATPLRDLQLRLIARQSVSQTAGRRAAPPKWKANELLESEDKEAQRDSLLPCGTAV